MCCYYCLRLICALGFGSALFGGIVVFVCVLIVCKCDFGFDLLVCYWLRCLCCCFVVYDCCSWFVSLLILIMWVVGYCVYLLVVNGLLPFNLCRLLMGFGI